MISSGEDGAGPLSHTVLLYSCKTCDQPLPFTADFWHPLTPNSSRQLPTYSYPAPPPALKDHISDETYTKAQAYGKEKARFSLIKGLWSQVVNVAMISMGIYTWGWDKAGDLMKVVGISSDRWVG